MLLISIAVGIPAPIQPLPQIINLVVTHILCTLPFAAEGPEDYAMKVPPRDTKTDLVVPWIMWKFRWLPFILCHSLLGVSSVVVGVWASTGHCLFKSLIGSSKPGDLDRGVVNCEFAGTVDESGVFLQDQQPFHCRCQVYASGYPIGTPEIRDQWGNTDANNVLTDFNVWTGDTGSSFLKDEDTPWEELLEPCDDYLGVTHNCWTGDDDPRPLLPAKENCAHYGTMMGQSMSYAAIQLGEILTILTYRRDDFFAPTMFANKFYNICLCGNLVFLLIVLYFPPVRNALEFVPLTFGRLSLPVVFACCLVFANEFFKVLYRSAKAEENERLGQEAMSMTGHSDETPNSTVPSESSRSVWNRFGAAMLSISLVRSMLGLAGGSGVSRDEAARSQARTALLEEGREVNQERVQRAAAQEKKVQEVELQALAKDPPMHYE